MRNQINNQLSLRGLANLQNDGSYLMQNIANDTKFRIGHTRLAILVVGSHQQFEVLEIGLNICIRPSDALQTFGQCPLLGFITQFKAKLYFCTKELPSALF